MDTVLKKYLPERAVNACLQLIKETGVHLKIVNERVTRHGDYRRMSDGKHQITVNATPHGREWKQTFQHLMLPFIRPEVFPPKLLPLLALHFKNPKASSSTDAKLSIALKTFDTQHSDNSYVFELPIGSIFRLYNGKIYRKGNRRVKRYECIEMATGKMYLFQPNAEVELIKN